MGWQNTELIPEARFSFKEKVQELGDSFGISQIRGKNRNYRRPNLVQGM